MSSKFLVCAGSHVFLQMVKKVTRSSGEEMLLDVVWISYWK